MAGHQPSCEFHVPISPTPDFLRRVWFLAASIERYAGLEAGSYRIVVTVGDPKRLDLDQLCPWASRYPIDWRWIDQATFDRLGLWGNAYLRYCHDYDADVVVMLDGDTLVTGSLADAVASADDHSVRAVPAYFSPFYLHPELLDIRSPRAWWREIFAEAGLGEPDCSMEHPGWPIMAKTRWATLRTRRWAMLPARRLRHMGELRWSPPYPNAGVVMAGAAAMTRIGTSILSDIAVARRLLGTALDGQVGLTLAMTRLGLDWRPLPVEYNFQNVPAMCEAYPEAAMQVRVLHFLNPGDVDRRRDFLSDDTVSELVRRRGLSPINQFLVGRLRALHASGVASAPAPEAW